MMDTATKNSFFIKVKYVKEHNSSISVVTLPGKTWNSTI